MSEIRVPNDVLVKFYLNDLRFRSFVTLKYLLPCLKKTNINHCVKHSIRFLILNYLTKNNSISKENALYLCQEKISFAKFNYFDFSEIFEEINTQLKNTQSKNISREIRERKVAIEMDMRRIKKIAR